MTKLEELKAAYEAAKAPGYRKEGFDEAFAKFTDSAFALMPTLLEAVKKLQQLHRVHSDHDDEYWATNMCKEIHELLEKLK